MNTKLSLVLLASLGLLVLPPSEGQGRAKEIDSMVVEITTADVAWAGTDNKVYLFMQAKFGQTVRDYEWRLDNPDDDFERGDTNVFRLTDDLPTRDCDILAFKIRKSKDHWYDAGGWKLGGIRLYCNDDPGQLIYENPSINKWLEDNHREWRPDDFWVELCQPDLPDPPASDSYADECSVQVWTVDDTPLNLPDRDCDGIADDQDPAPDQSAGDSDGDGIADDRERLIGTDPHNPDTDGDGIPDGLEDHDKDGQVDLGETDPLASDSDGDGCLDGVEDADSDGLPDWYEVETDPHNPDSDGDGWADGPTNTRIVLMLDTVRCKNAEVDWGDNEFFAVVDDVRWPMDKRNLDGSWDLTSGDTIYPLEVVARRVQPRGTTISPQLVAEFWEDDWFDWSDNRWKKETIQLDPSGTTSISYEYNGTLDTIRYELVFVAYMDVFADPSPASATADQDQDGLTDEDETELSLEMNGLADPWFPDIFLELDWVGEDQEPEHYTKIDVCSQFSYHNYPIHLDDGDFPGENNKGGGQTLPYSETVYLRSSKGSPSAEEIAEDGNFAESRRGRFHYVLAVDVPGEFTFGVASSPYLNDQGEVVCKSTTSKVGLQVFKSDFLDQVSDMESIVFMHELGHTLGLCHRPGDKPPHVVPAPHCPGPSPSDCGACRDCSHYVVSENSDTAMGNPAGHWYFLWIDVLIEAIDREINFDPAEWEALNLTGIRDW